MEKTKTTIVREVAGEVGSFLGVNPWNVIDFQPQRTPKTILSEVAQGLDSASSGKIKCGIESNKVNLEGGGLGWLVKLYLYVPKLGNMRIEFVSVAYRFNLMYPCNVFFLLPAEKERKVMSAQDETQLMEAIRAMISHDLTKKMITSIVSHINNGVEEPDDDEVPF